MHELTNRGSFLTQCLLSDSREREQEFYLVPTKSSCPFLSFLHVPNWWRADSTTCTAQSFVHATRALSSPLNPRQEPRTCALVWTFSCGRVCWGGMKGIPAFACDTQTRNRNSALHLYLPGNELHSTRQQAMCFTLVPSWKWAPLNEATSNMLYTCAFLAVDSHVTRILGFTLVSSWLWTLVSHCTAHWPIPKLFWVCVSGWELQEKKFLGCQCHSGHHIAQVTGNCNLRFTLVPFHWGIPLNLSSRWQKNAAHSPRACNQ